MKKGFDHEKYVMNQSKEIKSKIKQFDKLYLEIGGKLFDDIHASRVLPGFLEDSKIKVLSEFKEDLEIIFCIKASDIEKRKMRSDYGITYDVEMLNLIEKAKTQGFNINSVVITLYENQDSVNTFINRLERDNIKTYIHTATKGYPTNLDIIVSDEGYGANPYITTTKKLVLVNAPGAKSGKLATCLSQLYHEYKLGVNAGYAKFETFPIWDLPLKHPLNIAYEAAAADRKDFNMIDPFHLEKYNKQAVNYNRDVETFPILKSILQKITNKHIYHSPTDMSINTISKAITNMNLVEEACKKEVVRRYYNEQTNYKLGTSDAKTVEKVKLSMTELAIDENYLKVVNPAKEKSLQSKTHAMAIRLPNGKIITGRETSLLTPASSLIINAMKVLTKVPDEIDLLAPTVIEPILKLRQDQQKLSLQEVLVALSIFSVTNPIIEKALQNAHKLEGCDVHSTYIVQNGDLRALKSLKVNLTNEPEFYSNEFFK